MIKELGMLQIILTEFGNMQSLKLIEVLMTEGKESQQLKNRMIQFYIKKSYNNIFKKVQIDK